jgi:hypothetical protein
MNPASSLQGATGSVAAGHFATLRSVFESYAFSTVFSFRHSSDEYADHSSFDMTLVLHLARARAKHLAVCATLKSTRRHARDIRDRLGKADTTEVSLACLQELLLHVPAENTLLYAPIYGHEGLLQQEWFGASLAAKPYQWECSQVKWYAEYAPRPSPLLISDDILLEVNKRLYDRALSVLSSTQPHELLGKRGAVTDFGQNILQKLMALGCESGDLSNQESAAPGRVQRHGQPSPLGQRSGTSPRESRAQLKGNSMVFGQRLIAPPFDMAFGAYLLPAPARYVLAPDVRAALLRSEQYDGVAPLPPRLQDVHPVQRQWPLALQMRDDEGMCTACQALSMMASANHSDCAQNAKLVPLAFKVSAKLERLSGAIESHLSACGVSSGRPHVEDLGLPVCAAPCMLHVCK